MTTSTGQCLCGEVRWALDTEPYKSVHCFCKMCRKAHGTGFATYWFVESENFRWVAGEDAIATYASSSMLQRHFCSHCGSVVPYRGVNMDGALNIDYVVVPAGSHSDGPLAGQNIFAADKAEWTSIAEDLPSFDAYPPESGYGSIDDEKMDAPADGCTRASCLCGAVRIEITQPFTVAHNCHCNRCRRGRSAAHASNAFTAMDAVRIVEGESKLKAYKVPDAKFFTQVFCETCGSKMPRLDAGRNVAVIPMGCLDDDPGIAPVDHIFVADKADWFEMTDELPQFEAYPPGRG